MENWLIMRVTASLSLLTAFLLTMPTRAANKQPSKLRSSLHLQQGPTTPSHRSLQQQSIEGIFYRIDVELENQTRPETVIVVERPDGTHYATDLPPGWAAKNSVIPSVTRVRVSGFIRPNFQIENATAFILNDRRELIERKLTSTSVGRRSVLAVIIQDTSRNTGEQMPTYNEATLSDSVFGTSGDLVNLKSQFGACSYDQLQFQTAPNRPSNSPSVNNIVNGVTTVKLNTGCTDANCDILLVNTATVLMNLAFAVTDPTDLADHVMYCLPPRSMLGIAKGSLPGWLSLYSDKWCLYVSAQMHEIGHNINFHHSGEGLQPYGDQSGYMGPSYDGSDNYKMCFNAAKSWQSDWYNSNKVTFSVGTDRAKNIILHGIASPGFSPTSSSMKALIKIDNTASTSDYYINFNHATGINSETQEGQNSVMIVRDDFTGWGYESTLLSKLTSGTSWTSTIDGVTILVAVNSIDTTAGTAEVCITEAGFSCIAVTCSTIPPVLTATPGNGQVTLTWTRVANANNYEVYRTDIAGCTNGKALLADTTLLTFTDKDYQNGRQYYYEVIPKGSNGCFGPTSGCISATMNIAQCSNAGPLVTTTAGDRQVTLTWLSVGSGEYEVYRTSIAGCSQGKVLLGATTLLTYTDSGLQNGQQYYYEIIPMSNGVCYGPSSGCKVGTPQGTGGNGQWYVTWQNERCVQDCTPAGQGSCGGLAMPWDFLFSSVTECCQIKLSYKHLGWCENTSLGNLYHGSGEYYVDYDRKKCVRDCNRGGPLDTNNDCGGIIEDAWVDLYSTIGDCCTNKLSWIDKELCKDSSNPNSHGTNKYYADYLSGKCLKDCDPGGPECIRVRDTSRVLHDTIAQCCISQPWVDTKYCNSRSTNSYSDGWVVNYVNLKCIKDCNPQDGPPCSQPAHQDSSLKIYGTLRECCQTSLNWVSVDKCEADSGGIQFYTNKFYVDYLNNKCAKDCDPQPNGLPCAGNPQDPTTRLYQTDEECCQTALYWLGIDKCVADTNGVSVSHQGTGEWYVTYSPTAKCAKDCVGPSPCGGLKSSWDRPYQTSALCCSAISWVPLHSCTL